MAERRVYLVAWNEDEERWEVRQMRGFGGTPGAVAGSAKTREEAVQLAATLAKRHEPSQVLVKNRGDGRWSEERTYPRSSDPTETPG